MLSSVEAKQLSQVVRLVEDYEDAAANYVYVAIVGDGVTCTHCLSYEGLVFSKDEIPLMFPDAYEDGNTLRPNCHRTLWGPKRDKQCRCFLRPIELDGEDQTKKDGGKLLYVTVDPSGDLAVKAVRGSAQSVTLDDLGIKSLDAGVKADVLAAVAPIRLSDDKYLGVLAALLAAGVLSAAAYAAILKRCKQKKEVDKK